MGDENDDIQNGIIVFRSVLEIAREVLGVGRMTEAVTCRVIDAATRGMCETIRRRSEDDEGTEN